MLRTALLGLCLYATALAPAAAQEGGRVPVRVVEGRLLFECDVSTSVRRIPVNLFLDLDTLCGLQLHNRAAAPLGAETEDGQPREITVHFPDFTLKVPQREHGDEDYLDEFTKYHSAEMGENAVVGTLGAEVLKNYHLTFDLSNGYVDFQPLRERTSEPAPFVEGSTVVQVTEENGLVWLPVLDERGKQRAMALGGSRYDTVIDHDLCARLGAPDGDIGKLTVGGLDLSQRVAFRPEEVIQEHPDVALGVAGINVFLDFRIEIDRVNRWVRMTPMRAPDFPEDDLAFFQARAEDDPGAVEAFLDEYPQARLAGEAAELLVILRLDYGDPAEDVERALRWAHEVQKEDLRATAALDMMKLLADDGWPEYVIYAGELGLEAGRVDRYPDAAHKIHARLGDLHLAQGNSDKAWKHLLSAAFGMPEDGMVNLNLGRYYESQGRMRRAFSRYVQAAIVAESGPQALEGLQRVQKEMPESEPYSVDLVERMIEGKVMNFGAATRYEPDPESETGKTVLVEFFTNAHLGDETGGAIGGALGNEGLISHFRDGHAAFLSYHLPDPGLEPLVNGYAVEIAKQRGIDRPVVQVVDGTRQGPGAARPRSREGVYRAVRGLCYEALQKTPPCTLEIAELEVADDMVRGTVVVEGKAPPGAQLHLVLAERGVLFPGESTVVVHRMVARGALTPDANGVEVELVDGRMEYAFEASLDEMAAANEAWLDAAIAAGAGQTPKMSMQIDPGQVSVVAYVLDTWNGEAVQAAQRHHEEAETP